MLFLSILQENEQDRWQAQAGDVIPFNVEFFVPSKHQHGGRSFISRCWRATLINPIERNVLLQEKQLKLRGDREKNIYKKLKTRDFVLTPAYHPALLQATGMTAEFELIFKTIGCEDAWEIDEPGVSF